MCTVIAALSRDGYCVRGILRTVMVIAIGKKRRVLRNRVASVSRINRYRNVSAPDFIGAKDDGGGEW